MILFVVLLLVVVAVLLAAGAIDRVRKLRPAPHEQPKLPRYEQPALPPPPEKKFRRRPPPPPPPPGGTTGNFKRRVVSGKRPGRPNFNLPCRITGQPMSICGCARCRALKEKHGV